MKRTIRVILKIGVEGRPLHRSPEYGRSDAIALHPDADLRYIPLGDALAPSLQKEGEFSWIFGLFKIRLLTESIVPE